MLLKNNKSIKLYVIYHLPFRVVNSEILTPILCKRELAPSVTNMISADVLDEISYKNEYLAEYTTYYWVWKNEIKTDYIGFFQYKRYLQIKENVESTNIEEDAVRLNGWTGDDVEKILSEYDILLPAPNVFDCSLREQYLRYHSEFYLDKALEIIKDKYPNDHQYYVDAMNGNTGYFCNMFIMKREYFEEYMEFVFSIFNELEKVLEPGHQGKCFAYLGERLFNGYLNVLKSRGNVRINIQKWVFVDYPGEPFNFNVKV